MHDGAVKASGRFSGGRRPQRPKSQSLAPSMLSTNEFGTQAFVDDLLSSMEPVAESAARRAKRGASLDDSDDSDDGARGGVAAARERESLRDELRSAATSWPAAPRSTAPARGGRGRGRRPPPRRRPRAPRPRFGGKGVATVAAASYSPAGERRHGPLGRRGP